MREPSSTSTMRKHQDVTEEIQEGNWQWPIATVRHIPLHHWLGALLHFEWWGILLCEEQMFVIFACAVSNLFQMMWCNLDFDSTGFHAPLLPSTAHKLLSVRTATLHKFTLMGASNRHHGFSCLVGITEIEGHNASFHFWRIICVS